MKVQEALDKIYQTKIEQAVKLGFIGSYLRFMDDAVLELDDTDIYDKYEELMDLILDKREKLVNEELSDKEWY